MSRDVSGHGFHDSLLAQSHGCVHFFTFFSGSLRTWVISCDASLTLPFKVTAFTKIGLTNDLQKQEAQRLQAKYSYFIRQCSHRQTYIANAGFTHVDCGAMFDASVKLGSWPKKKSHLLNWYFRVYFRQWVAVQFTVTRT